jgi:peptidoglycan/LPS O-acetylase OafA/YrhL
MPNVKASTRIPELDGLRGCAILLVLLYHYIFGGFALDDKSFLATSVHFIFSLGWSGVDLFFVLSGFLIGGILIDQRISENYFKTFYIRRICRIFPLYFLWLTLFILLFFLISHRFHQEWFVQLFDQQGIPHWSCVLLLQNFHIAKSGLFGSTWLGATWSLAIEEQFYLLMPLIIWLIPVRKLPHLLVLLILLVPLFRIFFYLYHPNIFQFVLLPCRADALLLGVLCAFLLRNEPTRNWLEANQPRLFQMFAILALGVTYLASITQGKDIFYIANLFEMTSWGYTWLASFYACLLLIIVTAKNGMLVGIMRLPRLRNLGIIAYGVYLIHMVINAVAHGLVGKEPIINNLSDGLMTFVALIASLFLATLSWHFFEKPLIKWGHSFSYNDKNIQPVK